MAPSLITRATSHNAGTPSLSQRRLPGMVRLPDGVVVIQDVKALLYAAAEHGP